MLEKRNAKWISTLLKDIGVVLYLSYRQWKHKNQVTNAHYDWVSKKRSSSFW